MIVEDSYVSFLIEHDITQAQFLLLYLIYKNRPDLIRKYKEKFPSDDGTMIGQYYTDDLIKKGLLIKSKEDKITLSTKFLSIFINKHEACEQIFSVYPTHYNKDGMDIPLTAMDRNIFANLYDTYIQSSILEHLEVIKDIQYAKENNILNIGIEKFLKSKYWLIIRPKRLEGKIKETTLLKIDHDF
jgi:hypothetical protein